MTSVKGDLVQCNIGHGAGLGAVLLEEIPTHVACDGARDFDVMDGPSGFLQHAIARPGHPELIDKDFVGGAQIDALAEPWGQSGVAIVAIDHRVGRAACDGDTVAETHQVKIVDGGVVDRDAEKVLRAGFFRQFENAAGEVERRIRIGDKYDFAYRVSLVWRADDVPRRRQGRVEGRGVVMNVVIAISAALVHIEADLRIEGAMAGTAGCGPGS